MAGYYSLPGYRVPDGINLEPVNNALTNLSRSRWKQYEAEEQAKQQSFENNLATSREGRAATDHQNALTDRSWRMPLERQQMTQNVQQDATNFENQQSDRSWQVPQKRTAGDLSNDLTRSQIAENNAQAQQRTAQAQARQSMEQKLVEMGIDPQSAEGQMAMINNKLPAAYFTNQQAKIQRQKAATNIEGGLRNLAQKTAAIDDASFENSLGSVQGDEAATNWLPTPTNIAQGVGAVANYLQSGEVKDGVKQGQSSPQFVRDTVKQAADTLSTAIKPLIRGPGEGPWTDADQAQLNRIVGNLQFSRDKAEFKQRLNAVRDTLAANYGLQINFDAEKLLNEPLPPSGGQQQAAPAAAGLSAVKSRWGLE